MVLTDRQRVGYSRYVKAGRDNILPSGTSVLSLQSTLTCNPEMQLRIENVLTGVRQQKQTNPQT